MKLFIDSSQKIFIACIFNEQNKPIYKSIIDTKYKVEEILKFFNECPFFEQIREIYINVGPGSFTGSRISLLYIRTMAQVNQDIKIFTTNTFEILSQQKHSKILNKKFYINATKNKSYCLSKNKIKIIEKSNKEVEIDYELLVDNFEKYLKIFKYEKLINIKPIYASEPQIGEIKK